MLHIDQELRSLIVQYGNYIYGILFAVVFGETGLVIFPFLPGDSLLFLAGALSADGLMNAWVLTFLLISAAVLGNTVNYWIGRRIGHKAYEIDTPWFSHEHLRKTHDFYEKHGGKTLIISRFLPLFRTFAPFVAGIGAMGWAKFSMYNLIGAAAWVLSLCFAGYWLGNMPWVKQNLSLLIVGIIAVSLLPAGIGYLQHRRAA